MKGIFFLALICFSVVSATIPDYLCPPGLEPTEGPPSCDYYKVIDSFKNPEDTYEKRGKTLFCCETCKNSPWAIFFPPFNSFLRVDPTVQNALFVESGMSSSISSAHLTARVIDYETLNQTYLPAIFNVDFVYTRFEGLCGHDVVKDLADKCYEDKWAPGFVNPKCWECFKKVEGFLSGAPGSYFEGFVFQIENIKKSPQFGEGANGKNSGFGHYFAFEWKVIYENNAVERGTNSRFKIPSKKEDCKGEVAVNLIRKVCPPPPSFSGDPHFIGFLGQKYDFHGQANQVFSIISDETVQLNALFSNADLRPKKIDKTYIGAIGLMVGQHKLHIACDRLNGERVIEFDGDELEADEIVSLENDGSIMRDSEDRIIIDLPQYYIKTRFSSSAHSSCHINMRASYIAGDYELPHGVLGQSANPAKAAISKSTGMQGEGIIDGHWTDYRVEGDDLFGTNFIHNKFNVFKQTEASVEKRSVSTIH